MPTSSNNKKRNTRHKQTGMVVVLIVFFLSVVNIVRSSNLEEVLRLGVGIAPTSLENSTASSSWKEIENTTTSSSRKDMENTTSSTVQEKHRNSNPPSFPLLADNAKNNTTSVIIPYNPQRKIVQIHVGKCGGSSVDGLMLRKGCKSHQRRWRPEDMQKACWNFNRTALPATMNESEVSLHTLHGIHMSGGGEINSLFDTYLYAVRHPVDRVISSYYFLHYDNAGQSAFARTPYHVKDTFYKDCFPTLADFDRGLRPPQEDDVQQSPSSWRPTNTTTWSDCQRLALEILLDAAPREDDVGVRVNVHMTFGYQYYYDRGGDHSMKDILVIRTEHFWSDMVQLDQALGGTGHFSELQLRPTFGKKKKPSLDDIFHWCCLLYEENMVYQELIVRAINLSNQQKQDSLQSLYQRCGIDQHTTTINNNSNNSNNSSTSNSTTTIHHIPIIKEDAATSLNVLSWQDWHEQECPVWTNMPNQTWLTIKENVAKMKEMELRNKRKMSSS